MAKYYGAIGFGDSVETSNGVWEETITERNYSGDVLQLSRRSESGGDLIEDLTISNRISIVADAFATQNIFALRYITWMGSRWTIKSVEVQRPRLVLSIGGVYNG